ncbi:MAG: transporter substrate-binding domain-containing protein [Selenomonadaceae bacterium]|nr:transporter substrate-binding domain-containing protein [Selenomonadaceae bacterium]
MKKAAAALLCFITALSLFWGCGNGYQSNSGSQVKVTSKNVKLGVLAHTNASEAEFNEELKRIEKESAVDLYHTAVYYDNLPSMLMGLESGKLQEILIYDSVARYIVHGNDMLELAELHHKNSLYVMESFCCAVRKEDKELLAKLNKAIDEMRSDGTLAKLTSKYITELGDKNPPAVPLGFTAGAPVLKIAITGDLPPLDLIRSDGTPAGFNTAIMAELGKRMGMNVEIVQLENRARASALLSKKVDVVFWTMIPYGDENRMPENLDKPDDVSVSEPYYMDKVVHVKMKQ